MNEDDKGPMENLLDGLDLHSEFLSLEELKTELRARGIAIDDFLAGMKSQIAAAQKADRLSWMRIADEKRKALKAVHARIVSWSKKGEDEIRTAFAAFVDDRERNCALAFRKKSKLSVKDMARILDAQEQLRNKPQSTRES